MKIASLFSGAGALDLGLQQAGHELLLLCENDPGARQVLKAAFPGIQIAEDITSLASLPDDTEMVVAGFPCVDVSRAGLRRGLEGQSTGLVRHVFRLLRTARDRHRPVPWVLLENVEALLDRHGNDPPVVAFVVRQLMELGYGSWSYRLVTSTGFGLPNRRKRVFIVASLHGDARDVLLSQGPVGCQGGCLEVFGRRCYTCHAKRLAQRGQGADEEVAFAVDLGNAMSSPGDDVVPTFTTCNDRLLLLLPDGRSGMLRVEDGERLQGLPERWTAPCTFASPLGFPAQPARGPRPGREGEAEKQRWDLLGNAVTVPVGRWLGERFSAPYAYKYHGVRVDDRRMDDLIAASATVPAVGAAAGDAGGSGVGGPGAAGAAPLGVQGRSAANIWSFVAADELQEAVIFPYLVNERKNRNSRAALGGGGARDQQNGRENTGGRALSGSRGELEGSGSGDDDDNAAAAAGVAGSARAGGGGSGRERATARAFQDPEAAAKAAAAEVEETAFNLAGGSAGGGREGPSAQELFQSAILTRVERGSAGGGSGRKQTPWNRNSWPRCGWWVRGLGAFAVMGMNENPVLTPFQPLGEFITEVGRPPTEEERSSYVNRLQERGWQLSPTLLARLGVGQQGGGASGSGGLSAEVVRLPGLLEDSDMVGDIVWAPDTVSGIHWPGEVFDPLAPVPGRSLPPGAIDKLTPEQRRASLPCADGSYNPLQESAQHRRVFVRYLPVQGPAMWQWHNPADLLPFEDFLSEKERAANAAGRSPGFKFKDNLKSAIQDAKSSAALKAGRAGLEAERMRRTRAAAAAAAVDMKQRCGRCRTCTNTFSGTRRYDCLSQRMKAAALSGHAGAQIAVCGPAAAGGRVSVWWDGDQTFFQGVVCAYDPGTTEHAVAYDDGEVGLHKLWQHDERIRVLNDPEEWPKQALALKARLKAANEVLVAKKMAKEGKKAAEDAEAEAAVLAAALEAPLEAQWQLLQRQNRSAFEFSGPGISPPAAVLTPAQPSRLPRAPPARQVGPSTLALTPSEKEPSKERQQQQQPRAALSELPSASTLAEGADTPGEEEEDAVLPREPSSSPEETTAQQAKQQQQQQRAVAAAPTPAAAALSLPPLTAGVTGLKCLLCDESEESLKIKGEYLQFCEECGGADTCTKCLLNPDNEGWVCVDCSIGGSSEEEGAVVGKKKSRESRGGAGRGARKNGRGRPKKKQRSWK